MKTRRFLLLILLANIQFLIAQTKETAIAGYWYEEDLDKSTIEVFKGSNGFWSAKILKSADAKKVNKVLFTDGVFNAKDVSYKATLTHPSTGMEIGTTMTIEAKKLKIVGKKFVITKTFYWDRP
jgi:hypothetical protein